jgi:hypothetical protein
MMVYSNQIRSIEEDKTVLSVKNANKIIYNGKSLLLMQLKTNNPKIEWNKPAAIYGSMQAKRRSKSF